MSKSVTKGQTVPSQKSVVQTKVAPDAEIHMLVGGPYTLNGEEHRYGHTAVRIKTAEEDLTYDFGRYGRVTGDFGAEGEGILRVWSNFPKYISAENSLGRTTTGFVYKIFRHQAKPALQHFGTLIAAGMRQPGKERGRPWLQVYKLTQNYHALGPNCTTVSLDAATKVWPKYEYGSDAYIRPERVLNLAERAALKIKGLPKRIFLPANLHEFLSSTPPIRVDRTDHHP